MIHRGLGGQGSHHQVPTLLLLSFSSTGDCWRPAVAGLPKIPAPAGQLPRAAPGPVLSRAWACYGCYRVFVGRGHSPG